MNAWEQVQAVLAEAKRESLPWERAWYRAMEALSPTTDLSLPLRQALEEDRDLQREIKPYWRAAYEGDDVTLEEFVKSSAQTEKRLDSVLCHT